MKIGILALQGAFEEHEKVLDKLGVTSVEIRNLDDFQQHQSDLSGLIMPGGNPQPWANSCVISRCCFPSEKLYFLAFPFLVLVRA